jgi:hypothetical protein
LENWRTAERQFSQVSRQPTQTPSFASSVRMRAKTPKGERRVMGWMFDNAGRRGLFRTEYSGTTLRDHFGLPRPPSRFAKQAPAAASA